MKYEFRATTLNAAVARAVAKPVQSPSKKSSATIDADVGRFAHGRISARVSEGARYTISWEARRPASDDLYAIEIEGHNGEGRYSDQFSSHGSASFTAPFSGTATFNVRVSIAIGSRLSSYPVTIRID